MKTFLCIYNGEFISRINLWEISLFTIFYLEKFLLSVVLLFVFIMVRTKMNFFLLVLWHLESPFIFLSFGLLIYRMGVIACTLWAG